MISPMSVLDGRQQAAEKVIRTQRFQGQIEALALKLDQPLSKVSADAERAMREIVSVQHPFYCYQFDNVLLPLHTNAWSLDYKKEEVEEIKRLNEKQPLIFLPTHRSYGDPFLMTRILKENGLPRNHILGGNNQDFFPLGTILKRSGGVLFRRSFKGDEVYKMVVREYLAHLIERGANLEWYMEGGRSRTGKLRPPRFGLLHYLVRALERGTSADMLLVPVSITYDQMREVTLMAEEEAGVRGKAPEGVRWMAQYFSTQREWVGNAFVRFGEPLSLRSALAGGDEGKGNPWAVEKVAFTVFQRINSVTPVTAPALVTLALLGSGGKALTLTETTALIQPLLDYAQRRGLPTEAVEKLRAEQGVYDELLRLEKADVLERYEEGDERVFLIEEGKHAVAAFYRNSAIHWFVNRAILEMAIMSVVDSRSSKAVDQAWDVAFDLRDLLKFEFFFSDREAFREEIKDESRIMDSGFRERAASARGRQSLLAAAPFTIAHRVLTQFFEAYYILADRLAAWPAQQAVDKAELLEQCTKIGRQYVMQRRLSNPESVSRELCGNALQLADNRNLLTPAADIAERRAAFAAEIGRAVDAVMALAELDVARNASHVATGHGDASKAGSERKPRGRSATRGSSRKKPSRKKAAADSGDKA